MTPSDKPESAASHPQQDAESTSVITQSKDGNTGTEQVADGVSGSPGESSASSGDSSNPEELDGTDAPPPWQRGTVSSEPTEQAEAEQAEAGDLPPGAVASAFARDSESTQQLPRPGYEPGRAPTEESAAGEDSKANRTTVSFAGASATRPGGSNASARRPSRGPRRASLQIKRLDPWSVLKLALVLSVALFFVWMIAVAVLYGVLDGMGVWDQLNGTFTELTQPDDAASDPLISAGRVFGVASIIGAVNIVLITALSTVAAFIYNVAADFAGGVEVTLSERE